MKEKKREEEEEEEEEEEKRRDDFSVEIVEKERNINVFSCSSLIHSFKTHLFHSF